MSPGSEDGGALEGFEGGPPDSTDLPAEPWVDFGEAPEWRLDFPESWLFGPPDGEVSGLAFAWLFDLFREWPLGFGFFGDAFSGRAGDSGSGEAVDGAGDSVAGACPPGGSGAGVEGGCG